MTEPLDPTLGASQAVNESQASPYAQLRQGQVTVVDTTTGEITVAVSGDTANPIQSIKTIEPYSANVGDVVFLIRSGSDILCLGPVTTQLPDPVRTATNGTTTTGTSWVRDDVLGPYTFYAVAGRRYRAVFEGGRISTDTVDVTGQQRISFESGTTLVTASSTVITEGQIRLKDTGGVGETTLNLSKPFTPGAGQFTIGVLTKRAAPNTGTSILTPTNERSLYVMVMSQ